MRIAFLFLLFTWSTASVALDACVSSAEEFSAALDLGAQDTADDDIRLRQGSIRLIDDVEFLNSSTDGSGMLNLSGGWDTGCVLRHSGAQQSTLDASDITFFNLFPTRGLAVSDLTVANAVNGAFFGIDIESDTLPDVQLNVSRVAVLPNSPVGDALGIVLPFGGLSTLENVLVDAQADCSLVVLAGAGGRAIISSSTFVSRTQPGTGTAGNSSCFDAKPAAAGILVTNSIFRSEGQGGGLWVGDKPIQLHSSVFDRLCSPCGVNPPLVPESSGNVQAFVDFDAPSASNELNFSRISIGAAQHADVVDAADSSMFPAAALDLLGQPRVAGAAMDRGAIESPRLFSDGFESADPKP